MSTQEKLTPENSALLLIDHQEGIVNWVKSIDTKLLKCNTKVISKAAKAMNIPTVITTSMEAGANGKLIKEVSAIFPNHPRYQRQGIVNAWDDAEFLAAVKKTGRKNLIMAGVTTDVCLIFPVLSALEAGYNVYALNDASGSITKDSDLTALDRMQKAGAVISSTQTTLAQLTHDWTGAHGQKVFDVLMKDFLPFHLMRMPFFRKVKMIVDFIFNGKRYEAEFKKQAS